MSNPVEEKTTSPVEALISMVMGTGMVQILGIGAELGVADLLKDGPLTADGIARICGTVPLPTYRVLRALGNFGVLKEEEGQVFSLTPVGAGLLKDAPGSFNALARMTASSWLNQSFTQLLYTLKTGKSAFEKAHGMSLFEWLSLHPGESEIYQKAMSTFSGMEVELVTQACDFSGARCVVDVGGGLGMLITTILKKNPGIKGILFDIPEVTANSEKMIQAEGLSDRCEVISGSFFQSVPPGGEIYLLKHILHDWDDEMAGKILENMAQAMTPGAHILVMEQGITPPGIPGPGKLMDMSMMALTDGGRERTPEEFMELFEQVNIKFLRAIPTPGPITIFEGVRQ